MALPISVKKPLMAALDAGIISLQSFPWFRVLNLHGNFIHCFVFYYHTNFMLSISPFLNHISKLTAEQNVVEISWGNYSRVYDVWPCWWSWCLDNLDCSSLHHLTGLSYAISFHQPKLLCWQNPYVNIYSFWHFSITHFAQAARIESIWNEILSSWQ